VKQLHPLSRRRVLKGATGVAAGMCASGVLGKAYQRTLAQDDVRAQILQIPGAGITPTDADMERVGELCLKTENKDKFKGQTVRFQGLSNANAATTSSARCRAPGRKPPAPPSISSTSPRPIPIPRWPRRFRQRRRFRCTVRLRRLGGRDSGRRPLPADAGLAAERP